MDVKPGAALSDLEKLRLLLDVSRLVAGKLELRPLIHQDDVLGVLDVQSNLKDAFNETVV